MQSTLWVFVDILLLTFGLFLVLAGAFTAYFGSGKSRGIGVGLLVFGIVIWVVVAIMHLQDIGFPIDLELMDVLKDALVYIGAAIIGALAAIGIFLVAIMKS
jgi:hypothetical protein